MHELHVDGHHGQTILIDLCFHCHGIWFDGYESQQLSPRGVLGLFEMLHAHRDQPHGTLRSRLSCPVCRRELVRGTDRTVSGTFTVYRCPNQHGRFSTFSSFMVEKGFVRHLTSAEINQLASRLRIIHCGSCGAPVDLRKDHACPFCRSAFSLLDPQAVTQALEHYHRHAAQQEGVQDILNHASRQVSPAVQAELALARHRIAYLQEQDQLRENLKKRQHSLSSPPFVDDILWSALKTVWHTLSHWIH